MIYQVDLNEDELVYQSKENFEFKNITSENELFNAIDDILTFHKSDRIEIALKQIHLANVVSGICPKSFPRTQLTKSLFSMLNLCVGGEHDTELIHLPFLGDLFNQPNIFIEAYFIYKDEINKYLKFKEKQIEVKR